MLQTAVYYHPVFLEHDTGAHPESAARLEAATSALHAAPSPLLWREPEPATREQLERVHTSSYIENVKRVAERGGGMLDLDTVVSPDSFVAAERAAGAGVQAVERALAGGGPGFCLVRPPGHHALANRGMGFCLFNNVAIAAAHALEDKGLDRVFILDWDVHHGNGTQDAFYGSPAVLYVSLHEQDHYPGTGAVREVGSGAGEGYTVNVPLPWGSGNGAVRAMFERLVEPLIREFRPQLLLVSAGYDSQEGDPLGGLALTPEAYQWMAGRLLALSRDVGAAGPVCFLEGGYDPRRLAQGILLTVRGLEGEEVVFEPQAGREEQAAVETTVKQLRAYWSLREVD